MTSKLTSTIGTQSHRDTHFWKLDCPTRAMGGVEHCKGNQASLSAELSLQATLILPKRAQVPLYESDWMHGYQQHKNAPSRVPSYDGLAVDSNNDKGGQCGMPALPLQDISVISWLGRWYRRCYAIVGSLVGQRVGLRLGPHP